MALNHVQGYYPPRDMPASRQAYAGVTGWFAFHQAVRINQALDNRAPMAVRREVVAYGRTTTAAVDMTCTSRSRQRMFQALISGGRND